MARERAIQIRVSHDEYEAIKAAAGDQPIGAFLRDLGLAERPGKVTPVDEKRFKQLVDQLQARMPLEEAEDEARKRLQAPA